MEEHIATEVSRRANEDALRCCLERIVADDVGGRTAIVDIHRRRSAFASSYAAEIVTVRLATGRELNLFLKDFGSYHHPQDATRQRCERELRVYRDLLPAAHLDTARYYDAVWDEPRGRRWLLLEFVDGLPLRWCDVECWIAAARWLGRMHGFSTEQGNRREALEYLLRHDAASFFSTADLAMRTVSQIAPPLANRLAYLVARYDRIVDVMARQPAGLAHGSFRPKNILVDVHAEPVRVCPVDWELAAVGSPLYDLAFLVDGFEPPILDRLFDAYRESALEHDAALPGREEMVNAVNCFRLHKVMKSLSEARDRRFLESVIAKLVESGERLYRLLNSTQSAKPWIDTA